MVCVVLQVNAQGFSGEVLTIENYGQCQIALTVAIMPVLVYFFAVGLCDLRASIKVKDESAGADAETKSIIDGADDASQLDAAESVREAEHSRPFELRNPTDEVEPILPKGESEDLLQQLDREQAAMKIQSMQRGRAARAKLTSRLSRKQSMRADTSRPPQNVRPRVAIDRNLSSIPTALHLFAG